MVSGYKYRSSYKLNIFRNRTCRTCICHIPGILQYVYMTNMRHELFREGYLLLAFLKRVHILANLSMILVFYFLWVTHSSCVFFFFILIELFLDWWLPLIDWSYEKFIFYFAGKIQFDVMCPSIWALNLRFWNWLNCTRKLYLLEIPSFPPNSNHKIWPSAVQCAYTYLAALLTRAKKTAILTMSGGLKL